MRAAASAQFGVATRAYGSSRSTAATTPSRCPLVATSTGSTTRCGSRPAFAASATASATAGVPSIPVFTARTAKSVSTLSSCSVTVRGGSGSTASTPRVFCAVTAVSTLVPYAPRAAKTFRSAWMPAPPPESEPAMVSTVVGVMSSPRATPRTGIAVSCGGLRPTVPTAGGQA